MPDRAYSDAEIDAAVQALTDSDRMRRAQETVAGAVPQLQRVLSEALDAGGWFEQVHEEQLRKAAGGEDLDERVAAIRILLAEETRIGMLVGVAVGFELAHELQATTIEPED